MLPAVGLGPGSEAQRFVNAQLRQPQPVKSSYWRAQARFYAHGRLYHGWLLM